MGPPRASDRSTARSSTLGARAHWPSSAASRGRPGTPHRAAGTARWPTVAPGPSTLAGAATASGTSALAAGAGRAGGPAMAGATGALANRPPAQASAPRHARADVHTAYRGSSRPRPRATRRLPQGGWHTHQGPSRATQRQPSVARRTGYSRRYSGCASQGQATRTGLRSHGSDDASSRRPYWRPRGDGRGRWFGRGCRQRDSAARRGGRRLRSHLTALPQPSAIASPTRSGAPACPDRGERGPPKPFGLAVPPVPRQARGLHLVHALEAAQAEDAFAAVPVAVRI